MMHHAVEPPQLVKELPQPVCRTGNRQPQCPHGRDPLRCKSVAVPVARLSGRGPIPQRRRFAAGQAVTARGSDHADSGMLPLIL